LGAHAQTESGVAEDFVKGNARSLAPGGLPVTCLRVRVRPGWQGGKTSLKKSHG
jgi:hypothetical protein